MSLAPACVLDTESEAYPRHLLDDVASGLLLFCSGRMGAADGHWFREAGLTDVQCVDWDEKTLDPFRAHYPEEWYYTQADAFLWAELAATRRWDIVSADAPSQYADRMYDALPVWCRLANSYVTATVMRPPTADDTVPEGWTILGCVERAVYPDGRTYHWLILERL